MITPSDIKLLEVDAVAAVLGVSRWSIYRWCAEGRIPCVRAGRKVRFELEAVLSALRTVVRSEAAAPPAVDASLERTRPRPRRALRSRSHAQSQHCGEMLQHHSDRIRAVVSATRRLGT